MKIQLKFITYITIVVIYIIASVNQPGLHNSLVGKWEGVYNSGNIRLEISSDMSGLFYYLPENDTSSNVVEGKVILDLSKKIPQMSIVNLSNNKASQHTIVSISEPDTLKINRFKSSNKLKAISLSKYESIVLTRIK